MLYNLGFGFIFIGYSEARLYLYRPSVFMVERCRLDLTEVKCISAGITILIPKHKGFLCTLKKIFSVKDFES